MSVDKQTAEFGDNGAEHHAFDCGAMTLAQARLRHGKSLSPGTAGRI